MLFPKIALTYYSIFNAQISILTRYSNISRRKYSFLKNYVYIEKKISTTNNIIISLITILKISIFSYITFSILFPNMKSVFVVRAYFWVIQLWSSHLFPVGLNNVVCFRCQQYNHTSIKVYGWEECNLKQNGFGGKTHHRDIRGLRT